MHPEVAHGAGERPRKLQLLAAVQHCQQWCQTQVLANRQLQTVTWVRPNLKASKAPPQKARRVVSEHRNLKVQRLQVKLAMGIQVKCAWRAQRVCQKVRLTISLCRSLQLTQQAQRIQRMRKIIRHVLRSGTPWIQLKSAREVQSNQAQKVQAGKK